MQFSIREVTDKNLWENFVLSCHPNSFLQSWDWGEFSRLQDEQPFYLGIFDEKENLAGVALFTKIVAKRGAYLTCHGGPMIDWGNPDLFETLLTFLRNLGKKEKVWFVRIRPPFLHSEEKNRFFRQHGFLPAPMYFQAEYTLHLDLSLSPEILLSKMRKNTRYGINRGQREGVQVGSSATHESLERFFKIYQTTVQRQNFVGYPKKYLEDQLEVFGPEGQFKILLASYQNEVLAAAIVLFYGDYAYYYHGASIRKHEEKCAAYLLQWEAILEAKRRGFKFYDFWGVAPSDDPSHPRAGLTFFKLGFGGQRIRWQQTVDLPLSWKYWLTYGFIKFERLQRGL